MTMKEKVENFKDEHIIQLMSIKDEAELDKLKLLLQEQQDKISKAKNLNELKSLFAEAGLILTDDDMENVVGGLQIPGWPPPR